MKIIKINSMIICFSLFWGTVALSLDNNADIEKEINLNLENKTNLEQEKMQLESKISDLKNLIKEKKSVLLKRAKALSYQRKFQWGNLLSQIEDPTQLDRNIKIFNLLSEYDLRLFKTLRLSLKNLNSTQDELKQTLIFIEDVSEKLKKQQTEQAIKEKKYLLQLVQQNSNSFLKLKGHLTRPLNGKIISAYGSTTDSTNQFNFMTKGLLYETKAELPVQAIGPGLIIFSDVVDHWRETLIIQHDDNYYSVYTGLKKSTKKLNQLVEANEIIGGTSSNEFYFELRHFDTPINPSHWFKESL